MDYKAKIGDKVSVNISRFELNRSIDFVLFVVLKNKEMVRDYLTLKPSQFIKKHTKIKLECLTDKTQSR